MQRTTIYWMACVLVLLASASGRTMDRCSLALEMDSLGVPRHELPYWVCIAEHESNYRTHVKGPPNSDGSIDYGIFQINDRYWCQPSNGKESSNMCGISCDALLSDHISAAVNCARMVQSRQGWDAWTVYNRYCAGSLPSVSDCFSRTRDMQYSGSCHGSTGAGMYGKF